VLIQNLTFSNPPNTHISFRSTCVNVTVRGITISTPVSPNTDGMDVSANNMLAQSNSISDGDDNIAVDGGSSAILITNCAFGIGHGMSIGSYTDGGGVSNMTVINCTFNGTSDGIRLKSERGRGGAVQDLSYLNLSMTNVQWPVLIYSYYNFGLGTLENVNAAFAATDTVQTVTATTPIWQNITFSNITATTSGVYPPVMIWGLPEKPASNIILRNVNIAGSKNCEIFNAEGVQFIDSQITLPGATNTLSLYNAQLIISNSAPTNSAVKLDGLSTNGLGNTLLLYNARAWLQNTNAIDGSPGLTLAGSTLTVSNDLNLNASSILNFFSGTNAAEIAVTGNLAVNGTINVSPGPGFANSAYTLFTYGKTLTWGPPVLGSSPAGYACALATNTAGQVNLLARLPPIFLFPPPNTNFLVNPGATLLLTNSANDSDQPPPTLTFSLLAGETNASLDATSGLFTWRPLVSQANTTNYFKVAVSDDGVPPLNATNSFLVIVNPLAPALVSSARLVNGHFELTFGGSQGPDYAIQTSTDLTHWITVFRTNSPAMPFQYVDPGFTASNRDLFYRIVAGPPLP
jgi:hypothetical protein